MYSRIILCFALSSILLAQDDDALNWNYSKEISSFRYPLYSFPSSLPSLIESVKKLENCEKCREIQAIPFNLQKNTLYNYSFLGVNGSGSRLIFSDSKYLVTAERVTGTYADAMEVVHVWNSHDYSYVFSILVRAGYTHLHVNVDSRAKRLVLFFEPENQDRFYKLGGLVAYHWPSGEFHVKTVDCGDRDRDRDSNQYYPVLDAFRAGTFNGVQCFNGINIPLSKILRIQDVPELLGLKHYFQVEGETTLKRLDFNSLKLRHVKRIPHASEIQLESISGLPFRDDYTTEIIEDGNYGYLAIISGNRGALIQAINRAFMEDEPLSGVYIYNPRSNRLLHHPGNLLVDVRSAGYGYLPFYYDTGIGHLVHNGIASLRGHVLWNGPVLLDAETGKESVILFQGDKTNGAPIAYRIRSRLKGSETLGSSLCVWEPLPGDETKSYWLAGGENVCALILLDETTKTGRIIQSWQGIWGRNNWARNAANPVWIAEKQWLCLPVQENCWEVYEFKDLTQEAAKKCMIYTGSGASWALVLPDGRYAGSPGCEKLFSAMVDGKRVPMQKLAPWRNRPGEVLEAIGGNADDVVALKATTKRWLAKMNMNDEAMPPEPRAQEFPQVNVVSTELISYTANTSFDVRLAAAPKRALTTLDVRVNGASVEQSWSDSLMVPAGRQLVKTLNVPLNVGQNNVTLTPIDSGGRAGDTIQFRMVYPGDAEGRLFVVALGVSDYDDDALDLQFASKDARDLAEAFSKYGSGEVKSLVLTDKEVLGASVLEKVKSFLADSSMNDRVVLYLAGHGMLDDKLEYYYAPASFDAERVSETGISMDALVNALQGAPARERLLLLDTCHSGQLGEAGEEKLAASGVSLPHGVRAVQHRGMRVRKAVSELVSDRQQKRYIEDIFSMGTSYRGVNIVAGAAGAEFALESGDWNNGVFTASVIQMLRDSSVADVNEDGVLSVSEMLPELQRSVQKLTGGAQMPNIVAAENSQMGLARGLYGEMMSVDMNAFVQRIENAPDADAAMFLLDQLYCFSEGLNRPYSHESWLYEMEWLKKWGRNYDEEKQKILKNAYQLGNKSGFSEIGTGIDKIVVPIYVWIAVALKGVPEESILPVLQVMHVEDRDEIKEAIKNVEPY